MRAPNGEIHERRREITFAWPPAPPTSRPDYYVAFAVDPDGCRIEAYVGG